MIFVTKFVVQLIFILHTCFVVSIRIDIVPRTQVSGGSAVGHTYLKHVVILQYGGGHCGGAILTPEIILTAAHCVTMDGSQLHVTAKDIEAATVCAGTALLKCESPTAQLSRVRNVVVYERFRGATCGKDIALIFLTKPLVEDGITVESIRFPRNKVRIGDTCTTIGWGDIACDPRRPPEYPGAARYAILTVMPTSFCDQFFYLNEWEFCAMDMNGTTTPCSSDSGSPIICDGFLTGITSKGFHVINRPEYYTDVYGYRDWILDHIAPEGSHSYGDVSVFRMRSSGDKFKITYLPTLTLAISLFIQIYRCVFM